MTFSVGDYVIDNDGDRARVTRVEPDGAVVALVDYHTPDPFEFEYSKPDSPLWQLRLDPSPWPDSAVTAATPNLDDPQHPLNALDDQVGGDHYKGMAIQPVEFIHKNGLGYIPGNVIKYVCRYGRKGGVQDLKKARHYINMLIEMEGE